MTLRMTYFYKTLKKNIIKIFKLKKIQEEKKEKILHSNHKYLTDINLHYNSKFSKAVYKFITNLILKVEIRVNNEDNPNEKKNNESSKYANKIKNKIINLKDEDLILSNINYEDITKYNLDNNIDNEPHLEENMIQNISTKDNERQDTDKKLVIFIKPYLSFHLSEETKKYFLNNVDRSSARNKYKNLISYSDFFIFEMIYNIKVP